MEAQDYLRLDSDKLFQSFEEERQRRIE